MRYDLLKKAAEFASDELDKELMEYLNEAEKIDESKVPVDDAFLAFAKEYDCGNVKSKKNNGFMRFARVAILCIICTTVVGGITVGVTQAYGIDLIGKLLASDKKETDTAQDYIKTEVKEIENSRCYISYMPQNFELKEITDYGEMTIAVFYDWKTEAELRIYKYRSENTGFRAENDIFYKEVVEVDGNSVTVYENTELSHIYILWKNNGNAFKLEAKKYSDKEELLQIAGGVTDEKNSDDTYISF